MYENHQMKKILENELEGLKPEKIDSPEESLNKNIRYGYVTYLLSKVCDEIFVTKFGTRVTNLSNWLSRNILTSIPHQVCFTATDRIYNSAYQDGYIARKSEELTELFLSQPINRINEN